MAVGRTDDEETAIIAMGKKMRRRRKLLGLTQTQVAIALDVRFQQVQKYECGANKMSAYRMGQICKVLQVSPQYLLTGTLEEDATPKGLRLAQDISKLSPGQCRVIQSMVTEMLRASGRLPEATDIADVMAQAISSTL